MNVTTTQTPNGADGFTLDKVFPESKERKKMTTLLACLTCLICLVMLAVGVGFRVGDHWGEAFERNYVLELRPVPELPAEEQIETAMIILRNIPQVARAAPLSKEKMKELMAPWLGNTLNPDDLPLSRLVQVEIDAENVRKVLDRINHEISEIPGASIEGYHEAKAEYKVAGHSVRLISFAGACLLLAVVSAVTAIAAESGVLDNKQVIHTLRLIGSENRLISRIFTRALLRHSVKGALAGMMFALLIICIVSLIGAIEGLGAMFILAQFVPSPEILLLLPVGPLTVVAVTLITAKVTMRKALQDFI